MATENIKYNTSTNYIYVLKLEQGKYYIGKTNNIKRRYMEHLQGSGASWTAKYKPMRLEKLLPSTNPFDEDKYTKQYMTIFGINNVRGGTYVTDYLPPEQIALLKREIWAAIGACVRCGRKGHFYETCYTKTDINGDAIGKK